MSKSFSKVFKVLCGCVLSLVLGASCDQAVETSCLSDLYRISLEKAFEERHGVNASEIFKEFTYIILETNTRSVLSKINKMAFCESSIFIMSDGIHQFGWDGSYIRKVSSRGRGPGEYILLMDICADDSLNQLIVLSPPHTLKFDFNGKFIKQFRQDTIRNLVRVYPWKENKYMYYYWNAPKNVDSREYSLVTLNEHGDVLKVFNNHHKRVHGPYVFPDAAPFYLFKNEIRFKEFGVDTLYTINCDKLLPYAIFDLGNKLLPAEIQFDSRTDGALERAFEQHAGKFWLRDIVEDNENLYLSFNRHPGAGDMLFGIFQKAKCEAKILNDNGFLNDIDGGLSFFPRYVYSDSILVDYIDAYDLREHIYMSNDSEKRRLYGKKWNDLVDLANRLDDESNPVLVIGVR